MSGLKKKAIGPKIESVRLPGTEIDLWMALLHGNTKLYKLEVKKTSPLTVSVGHNLYACEISPGPAISVTEGSLQETFVRPGSLSQLYPHIGNHCQVTKIMDKPAH